MTEENGSSAKCSNQHTSQLGSGAAGAQAPVWHDRPHLSGQEERDWVQIPGIPTVASTTQLSGLCWPHITDLDVLLACALPLGRMALRVLL